VEGLTRLDKAESKKGKAESSSKEKGWEQQSGKAGRRRQRQKLQGRMADEDHRK